MLGGLHFANLCSGPWTVTQIILGVVLLKISRTPVCVSAIQCCHVHLTLSLPLCLSVLLIW